MTFLNGQKNRGIFMKSRKTHQIFMIVLNAVNLAAFIALLICVKSGFEIPSIVLSVVNASCFILVMINPLLSKVKMGLLEIITSVWFSIVFALVAVAYMFFIPNDKLSNIVLTVVSSTIGGFLTLMGVGLTIKHAKLEKEEDEIKALRPSVFMIDDSTWKTIPKDKKIATKVGINDEFSDFNRADKTQKRYELSPIFIANSDVSVCDIYGLMINERLIKLEFERVLPKNSMSKLVFNYQFEYDEKIESIDIILEDVFHNAYLAHANFTIDKKQNSLVSKIKVLSIMDIVIVDRYIGVARE